MRVARAKYVLPRLRIEATLAPEVYCWPERSIDLRSALSEEVAHSGSLSALLASKTPADIAWHQSIDYLTVTRTYLLCGWVQADNVVRYEDESIGANVAVSTPLDLSRADAGFGSFEWREACVAFTAVSNVADIMCRLGGPSSTATGTMWCDDVSLYPLFRAFNPVAR